MSHCPLTHHAEYGLYMPTILKETCLINQVCQGGSLRVLAVVQPLSEHSSALPQELEFLIHVRHLSYPAD